MGVQVSLGGVPGLSASATIRFWSAQGSCRTPVTSQQTVASGGSERIANRLPDTSSAIDTVAAPPTVVSWYETSRFSASK